MNDPKQDKPVTIITEQQIETWIADLEQEPVQLETVKRDLLDLPPHFKAEELAGTVFDILAIKPFKSSYEKQDHAFFVTCRMLHTVTVLDLHEGDIFTTVFGGQILTDTLDAVIAKGFKRALRTTLRFVKQGMFGGYYVFE